MTFATRVFHVEVCRGLPGLPGRAKSRQMRSRGLNGFKIDKVARCRGVDGGCGGSRAHNLVAILLRFVLEVGKLACSQRRSGPTSTAT